MNTLVNKELNCHFKTESMQVNSNNYSNLSPSSTTSSSTYSISPQDLQNMIINTNQMYLNNTSGSSNSPCSLSTSSMSSPQQIKSEPYINSQNDQYLDMSMSEDLDTTNNDLNLNGMNSKSIKSNNGNKVNRFFADGVVDILNKWFNDNQNYPYPDENMTNILAKEANISAKQVRKWFANKRVRSNKCCKQSRVQQPKKDSNRTRRQTKSVSEVDGIQLTFNMTDSDEFNTTNVDNMLDDNLNDSNVIRRNNANNNSTNRRNKRSSLYINSSGALSTSPSFVESSPIYSNDDRSNFNHFKNDSFNESNRYDDIQLAKDQHQQELFDSLNLTNLLIQQQKAQQNQDTSLLCNNLINSTAAIYPLIVMNLLQNPIALQTALANQLINTKQNVCITNQSNQTSSLSEQSSEYKAYNKRKTHLSNRFYRETNETNMMMSVTNEITIDLANKQQMNSNKCSSSSSSSSSSSADPEEYNNTTPTSSSSCSSYSSPLTMFDSYNNLIQSQQRLLQPLQKPIRKINFGDVSDLIN